MKRSRKIYAVALAAVLGVLGLGTTASPAVAADGFSIGATGPTSATVGQPLTLKVSGKNPTPGWPDYYWFGTWLSVDVIPASFLSSCPQTADEGIQMGVASAGLGGGYLVLTQRENVDQAGNWSSLVGYTPNVAGKMLICVYSDDGYTNTLARGQMAIDVAAPGTTARKACKKPRKRSASAARKCKKRK